MKNSNRYGRPGGNPDFGSKVKFQAQGDEPLEKHLQLRISASMKERLDKLGDRKLSFIREAIDKALTAENL